MNNNDRMNAQQVQVAARVNANSNAVKRKLSAQIAEYVKRIQNIKPDGTELCGGIMVTTTFTSVANIEGKFEIMLLPNDVVVQQGEDLNFPKISDIEIDEMHVDIIYNPNGRTGPYKFYTNRENSGRSASKKVVQSALTNLWNICIAAVFCRAAGDATTYVQQVYPRLGRLLTDNPEFKKRALEACRRNAAPVAQAIVAEDANVCVSRRPKPKKRVVPVTEFELQGWGPTHPDMSPYDMNDMLDRVLARKGEPHTIDGVTRDLNGAITYLLTEFRKEQESALRSFLASKGIKQVGDMYVYEPEAGETVQNASINDLLSMMGTDFKLGGAKSSTKKNKN